MPSSKKVLLIGWDAADWRAINPLIEQGKMPCLEALVNRGVMTSLATLHPPYSPILWTSIATGKRPFKHGVLGFIEPTPDGRAVQPVTNLSRSTKAVWNILMQEGYQSNVVGWWPSHPAEPIRGVMVSNHYHHAVGPIDKPWPVRPGTVHPPRLAETLGELRLHPEELRAEHILPFIPKAAEIDQDKDRRLPMMGKILAECSSVHSAATYLLENEPWDFMAVYYDAIDHFGHGFMKYHPPRQAHIRKEDFEIYSGVVEAGYRYHDMMLARLLSMVDESTTVILMSDHGFHPDHLRPKAIPKEPAGPAVEHRDFGILVIAGPEIKQDELIHGANLLDICPTILTLFGLPVGEDMDGKPLLEAFAKPRQIKTIPSWDQVEGQAGLHPPERKLRPFESKEALDQLVDLGYVDKPGENAEKAVERAVRELRYNLALSYMDCDRYREATEILEPLFEKEPNAYRFGVQLAMCYRALERAAEIRPLVERMGKARAAEAAEARKQLKEWRGKIEERKQERAKATDESTEEKKEKPLLSEEEAKEFSDLRRKAVSNPAAFQYLRGIAAAAEGDHEAALKALKIAEKSDPDRPGLHIQIGEAYLNLKRYADAERAFQTASHIDPDNPHARLGTARSLLGRRKNRLAAEAALQAAALLYHYPLAHYVLGTALHRIGRIQRAVQALDVAVALNPNFPEAHRRLARIYEGRLHDSKSAARHRELAAEAARRKRTIHKAKIEGEEVPTRLGRFEPNLETPPPPADRAERVTIVSGLPRSGTSLMMKMLDAAGLELLTDGVREADEDNPKGYYELEAVKKTRQDNSWLDDARGKAVKVIHLLLYDLPPDRHYDVVMMRRNIDEVIASQKKMLARRGRKGGALKEERMKRMIEHQLIQVSAFLRSQPNVRVIGVDYNAVLREPEPELRRLIDFLELEASPEDLAREIDGNLWRNRAEKKPERTVEPAG